MDIEECLLGSPPLVGATFSVPTTSVMPRLSPLAPLAPSLFPTTCGGNFWGAHHLCWAGLLPLLPACSPCSPHSQLASLAPLTPSLLPLTPLAPSSLPACSPCSQWLREARECYAMFWIPTTSVGARVSGVRGSELGVRGNKEVRGARGSEGSEGSERE